MAAHETVLRLRICLRPECRALFFLCSHCDRGHRYCGDRCRQQARREQRQRANRRHQQSPEGKLDHRDRQRRHRARKTAGRRAPNPVTDQGSFPVSFPARLPSEPSNTQPPQLRCRICGRTGRFVDPFPRARWRSIPKR
jgi:hypothetical protein